MPVYHPSDLANGVQATLQSGATATGNGTAANVYGARRLTVDLNGITTATVTWEGSLDGTNYRGISLANQAGTLAATATADGVYYLPAAYPSLKLFRARISAYTSGTINAIAAIQS